MAGEEKRQGSPLGIIVALGAAGLLLVLLIFRSSPSSDLPPEQGPMATALVQTMMTNGVLVNYDCARSSAWVNRAVWDKYNLDQKRNMTLGLATVWIMDFNWLASWLVISYALTIAAAVLGRITEDWARRVDGLAIEEKGATPGPELQAVLSEKAPRIIRMIDMVLILVFVGLMVFRPNFW